MTTIADEWHGRLTIALIVLMNLFFQDPLMNGRPIGARLLAIPFVTLLSLMPAWLAAGCLAITWGFLCEVTRESRH